LLFDTLLRRHLDYKWFGFCDGVNDATRKWLGMAGIKESLQSDHAIRDSYFEIP